MATTGYSFNALVEKVDGLDAEEIGAAPRPNLLLNGGFDIAQRGDWPLAGDEVYGLDRWIGVGNNVRQRQLNFIDHSSIVTAPMTSACQVSGTVNNWIGLMQRIESTNAAVAVNQTCTISGRVYTDVSTAIGLDDLHFWAFIPNARDNWASQTAIVSNVALNITNSNQEWVDFSYTFDVPDCRRGLSIQISTDGTGTIGSGNWIAFADMKLEVGSNATTFERPEVEEELFKCRRYFEKKDYITHPVNIFRNEAQANYTSFMYTHKRANPTIVEGRAIVNSGLIHSKPLARPIVSYAFGVGLDSNSDTRDGSSAQIVTATAVDVDMGHIYVQVLISAEL